jgi:hypothetical protein
MESSGGGSGYTGDWSRSGRQRDVDVSFSDEAVKSAPAFSAKPLQVTSMA